MAKLFGYPINGNGGGGGSIAGEVSRSGTQPDGEATSLSTGLPQRENNPYPRFLESGSGPMDSESDLHNCFIDFFGRESSCEIETVGRNQMPRMLRGGDTWGGLELTEEIELGLGIGSGSGSGELGGDSVIGIKEVDSGRVEAGSDLTPFEDDLFCEEVAMLMADEEELEWENLQNGITWESEPVQASLEQEEEEEDEEDDTEEEEEEEEVALPFNVSPNDDGLVEDYYEESLDILVNAFEGTDLMHLDYGEFLHELGEDQGDYYDVFAQSFTQESPVMGTRPASKRVVDDLPVVEITSEELRDGNIVCAICIGDVVVEEKVTRLPCWHYYHGECILPWLGMKNTCPVCRYELPTDDLEYERCRRSHR